MHAAIRFYTIQLQIYHDEIVGRLQFSDSNGQLQESALYPLAELNSIIELWKTDILLGSFAYGVQLAENAEFQMVQKC